MSSAPPTYAGVLARALENPDAPLEIAPLIVETARKNDKRQAYMKVAVDDDWVKNLTGNSHFADVYMLVRVPRENFAKPRPDEDMVPAS